MVVVTMYKLSLCAGRVGWTTPAALEADQGSLDESLGRGWPVGVSQLDLSVSASTSPPHTALRTPKFERHATGTRTNQAPQVNRCKMTRSYHSSARLRTKFIASGYS